MRELMVRVTRRTLGIMVLGLATLVVSPGPAAAQVDDIDALIRKVRLTIANNLNEALEFSRSDRPVAWSDQRSSLTGVITVYSLMTQNNRSCRSFKYVVHDATQEITDTGLYCRDPTGLWSTAGVPDIVATRLIGPAAAPVVPTPASTMPDVAQPDPQLAKLQRNLVRLAYDYGIADGLKRPSFDRALQQFQADEGMPLSSDPDAIRRALTQSTVAVTRADKGGTCEKPANSQGTTLVCGRRR